LLVALQVEAQSKNVPLKSTGSNFIYRLPDGYGSGSRWPLLVVLHGSGDRAENFIGAFEVPDVKQRFILVAINAKTRDGWDLDEDKPAIFEAIDHMKKRFAVDPDNVWLGGFSAGGGMTAHTGLHEHARFRGLIICGFGLYDPPADLKPAAHLSVAISCGDRDGHIHSARRAYETLKKVPFPSLFFDEIKGMGHTIRQSQVRKIMTWVLEEIRKTPPRSKTPKTAARGVRISLSVGVRENVPETVLAGLGEKLQEASDIIFRVTDGQVCIDKAKIADAKKTGALRFEEGAEVKRNGRRYVRVPMEITAEQLAREILRLKLKLKDCHGDCFMNGGAEKLCPKEMETVRKRSRRIRNSNEENGGVPRIKIDLVDAR
jgi:predicted esterase